MFVEILALKIVALYRNIVLFYPLNKSFQIIQSYFQNSPIQSLDFPIDFKTYNVEVSSLDDK